jgi:hypothetical protein
MSDVTRGPRIHLRAWMVWWLLVGAPFLAAVIVAIAGFGTSGAVRAGVAMSLTGVLVAVLVHTWHLTRHPGCTRCLQVLDWLALCKEAHNAGMSTDAFMDLARPGGPHRRRPSVNGSPGPRRTRAPVRARARTRSTAAR